MAEEQRVSRGVPQVVLVHGTFAGDPEDSGEAWWQTGSEFSESLGERLGGLATPVRDRPLFRWPDDANLESARTRAAFELLRYLAELERQRVRYHLVGHSHGGSVIWEALKMSCRRMPRAMRRRIGYRGGRLRHLLSWTTIGTPFIRKRVNAVPWVVSGVFAMVAMAALGAGLAMLAAPVVANLGWSGSIASDLEDLGLILAFAGLAVLFWLPYALLAGFVVAFDDGRQLNSESLAEYAAVEAYGGMWFGIWSPDDEALNSLRAAHRLDLQLVGSGPLARSPFVGRLWWVLMAPARWVTRLARRVAAPAVDGFVAKLLRRKVLGDDRPAPKTTTVEPCPFPIDAADLAGLDEATSARLRQTADEALRGDVPSLRDFLRNLAARPAGSIEEVARSSGLAMSGLVHTSYFAHPAVLELVAAHIAHSQGAGGEAGLREIYRQRIEPQKALIAEQLRKVRESRAGSLIRKVLRVPFWVFGALLWLYMVWRMVRYMSGSWSF